jgi:hypothetical protein
VNVAADIISIEGWANTTQGFRGNAEARNPPANQKEVEKCCPNDYQGHWSKKREPVGWSNLESAISELVNNSGWPLSFGSNMSRETESEPNGSAKSTESIRTARLESLTKTNSRLRPDGLCRPNQA